MNRLSGLPRSLSAAEILWRSWMRMLMHPERRLSESSVGRRELAVRSAVTPWLDALETATGRLLKHQKRGPKKKSVDAD